MEVQLMSLWLPIVLSAIAVFFASSLVWMVFQYHNSDWNRLPDEEAARSVLKGAAPGHYAAPYAASNEERKSTAWQEKCIEGPVAMFTVIPSGLPAMGKQLGQRCLPAPIICAFSTSPEPLACWPTRAAPRKARSGSDTLGAERQKTSSMG